MKKIIVILFSLIFSNISSAQSGWGYVNYTSYKLFNGNGSTNQYAAFPYSRAEFDNMLNTANSNTTITHRGETPIINVYNGSSPTVPHWNGDYYAIVFDFWFIPKVTGTYYFGINSDDASDLVIDNTLIATYYGGHGASGYQQGQLNMVAGQRYKVVVRYQEYGGGDALYFRWYRPNVGWGYWNDEVTNVNSTPSKQGRINFDFGSTLDKTKFNIGSALSSTGWIDITNSIDSVKIANGNKGTIVSGQVEWSYINTSNGTNTLYVDLRKFGNTDISTITQIKILDVYEGPVTYAGSNIYWAYYTIPSSIPKLTNGTSTYASNIRNAGYDNYAFSCDVSFASYMEYKPQSVTITTTNNLTTLYGSIVTVSDVYLAFKEYSNRGGLFGNGTDGGQFTYGIQYKNADVNDDGYFDEQDCYLLLQHLTGKKQLVDTFNLRKTLRLIPTSDYNNIGKSNWSTVPSYLGDTYNFDINTENKTDTFYISGTWKGDVNLSHSTVPTSNGITTMSLKTMSISSEINFIINQEIVGDSVIVTLSLNPLQQQVVGTQFMLTFDNSILNYSSTSYSTKGNVTNFSKQNSNIITIGSLNTTGGILDNATSYKISFKPSKSIDSILGLISISNAEGINIDGKNLNVKIL